MSDSKHTPSPWIVDGNGFDDSWNIDVDPNCNVKNRADADLIAAAPDMLRALRTVVNRIASDEVDEDLQTELMALINRITRSTP